MNGALLPLARDTLTSHRKWQTATPACGRLKVSTGCALPQIGARLGTRSTPAQALGQHRAPPVPRHGATEVCEYGRDERGEKRCGVHGVSTARVTNRYTHTYTRQPDARHQSLPGCNGADGRTRSSEEWMRERQTDNGQLLSPPCPSRPNLFYPSPVPCRDWPSLGARRELGPMLALSARAPGVGVGGVMRSQALSRSNQVPTTSPVQGTTQPAPAIAPWTEAAFPQQSWPEQRLQGALMPAAER